jgi:hypothetical protein
LNTHCTADDTIASHTKDLDELQSVIVDKSAKGEGLRSTGRVGKGCAEGVNLMTVADLPYAS